jgi:hypothetical protein
MQTHGLNKAIWGLGMTSRSWVEQGNMGLRHDIQVLADAGVIEGPVSTWPLAWGDIASDLETLAAAADLTAYELAALRRLRKAARIARRTEQLQLHSRVAVAENPVGIRNFSATPREDVEVEVGATYTGRIFASRLQATWVDDPSDGKEWRADGSYAGVALGNWMLALSAQDRWWGPGWQGGLILSNNARPVPSLIFERNATRPFKTKWLSWMGPWDFTFLLGRLEGDVQPADANFMGMRLNFRPTKNLEIGLNRTAQFCGTEEIFDDEIGDVIGTEDRPCDLDTFLKVLLGRDNKGENVSAEDEPGNQIAGFDVRYSGHVFSQPAAFYFEGIGEDASGVLQLQMATIFGVETWGGLGGLGSYRAFFEWADTECDFDFIFDSDGSSNLCYNSGIFEEGYRYRKRTIGHTFDNDSSVFSLGGILIDNSSATWTAKLNYGRLNRDDQGQRDPEQIRNTVAKEKTNYAEIMFDYTRSTRFGEFRLGAGYDYREIDRTGTTEDNVQVFLEWTITNFE